MELLPIIRLLALGLIALSALLISQPAQAQFTSADIFGPVPDLYGSLGSPSERSDSWSLRPLGRLGDGYRDADGDGGSSSLGSSFTYDGGILGPLPNLFEGGDVFGEISIFSSSSVLGPVPTFEELFGS